MGCVVFGLLGGRQGGACLLLLGSLCEERFRVFPERVEEAVEMLFAGEGVDDGDAEGADAVEVGGDDVELAGLDEAAAQLKLEMSHALGQHIAEGVGDVAEDDDVALGIVQGDEVGRGRELFVERPAEVEGDVDHVGEQVWAEHGPDAPEPESGGAFGAFDGTQAAVVLGQARGGWIEEVGGILAECLELVCGVLVQHEGAECRDKEHFVGVPDDAVGALEAIEEVAVFRAEAC